MVGGTLPNVSVDAILVMESPGSGSRQSLNGPIRLKADHKRQNINDTLNFRLPQDWTAHSSVSLYVEINPEGTLPETDRDNNRRDLSLTFNTRSDLTVLYLPIRYQPPGQPATDPTNRITTNDRLTRKLYPLRQGGLHYYRGKTITYRKPLATRSDTQALKKTLNKLYWVPNLLGAPSAPDQLIAWLPQLAGLSTLGSSDPLWMSPPGKGRVTFSQDTADGAMTMAHEMGHNLGRRHPDTADACGAADGGTDWPKADYGNSAKIREYGFDPFANAGKGEVKDAATKSDVMSYCSPPMSNIWISPFTYRKLYDGGM